MLTFAAVPVFAVSQGDIDKLNEQIHVLDNKLYINAQKQQSIQDIIDAIQANIDKLQMQIEATQAQIELTNQQIADTNGQIVKTEADLAEQKKILREYQKTLYMENQKSTVELIATSDTFSDFVDRSEYLNTMQQKVRETEEKIANLKKQLEQKKKDLENEKAKNEKLLADRVAQQNAITNQQNYQKSLLADAKASADSISNQRDSLYNKKAQLSAAFNETTTLNVPTGGGGSYPYGNPPPANRIDAADAYGYAIGECTSYAEWKRASVGRPVPRNLGNANTWGVRAAAQGYSVNQSPRAGDVMVFPYLVPYGHVAYVEAVYGNGNFLISEYNWTPYRYSQRMVNPWNYGAVFIH
jgi:surface antigen